MSPVLFELDNWLFFLLGAVVVGPVAIWLLVRSATKSGNAHFQKQVDALRGEIHDIRGEVRREFSLVEHAHKTIRDVANRAEKKADDLVVRVSRLEGQGEE